jgi:hypothetical protein
MLKNMCQIHFKIGENDHIYTCSQACSTTEVKEALFQLNKYVGQIEDAILVKANEEQEKSSVEMSEFVPELIETQKN